MLENLFGKVIGKINSVLRPEKKKNKKVESASQKPASVATASIAEIAEKAVEEVREEVKPVETKVVETTEVKTETKPKAKNSAKKKSASQKKAATNVSYAGYCVVLDPGHAKVTPGKRSPYSAGKQKKPELALEEWAFNREIVSMIKAKLEVWGIDVFVTTDEERDGKNDLGLSKRAARANDYVKKSGKKGVFVSVHADAHGYGNDWTSANGWSAYTTVGKTKSDTFADCLYDAAEKILKPLGRTIRTDKTDGDRDKESNFTVIVKASMPAVLTENLFYTNIKDTEFMLSDEGKNAIADVHVQGILNFFAKY